MEGNRHACTLILILSFLISGLPVSVGSASGDHSISANSLYIDNDQDLDDTATLLGWSGSGTVADPYVADNITIDASGGKVGLYIGNTTRNVVFIDCHFHNASLITYYGPLGAVYLINTTNVSFSRCNFSHSVFGVQAVESSSINLTDCTFYGNSRYGLSGNEFDGSRLTSCSFQKNLIGLYIYHCGNILFEECIMNSIQTQVYSTWTDNSTFLNNRFMDGRFYNAANADTLIQGTEFESCYIELWNMDDLIFSSNDLNDTTVEIHTPGINKFWSNEFKGGGLVYAESPEHNSGMDISSNNTLGGKPVLFTHDMDLDNASLPPGYGQYILNNISRAVFREKDLDSGGFPFIAGHCHDLSIISNRFWGNSKDIVLSGCEGFLIEDNSFSLSISSSVYIIDSDDGIISGNTLDNISVGIDLAGPIKYVSIHGNVISNSTHSGLRMTDNHYGGIRHCSLDENIFKDNDRGIHLSGSGVTGNLIKGNRILRSLIDGIFLTGSDGLNRIEGNVILGGVSGIHLRSSDHAMVFNNSISGASRYSILINMSHNLNIYSNEFQGAGFGISLFYGGDYYYNTIALNNTVNGLPIVHYTGDCSEYNPPDWVGQIVMEDSRGLKIHDIEFSNISNPIVGAITTDLSISGCEFNDCSAPCIELFWPRSTSIANNNFSNCGAGVVIDSYVSSSDTSLFIHHNNLSSIGSTGIEIMNNKGSKVESNSIKDARYGISFMDSNNCSISENLIFGSLESSVHLVDSATIRINENTFYGGKIGIRESKDTHSNVITFNIFSDFTGPAIHLDHDSSGDRIYNNAFFRNNGTTDVHIEGRPQVDDRNGGGKWFHPNGIGNHWFDMKAPDEDGDGVVDREYVLSGFTSDSYPLVEPPMSIASTPTPTVSEGWNGYVLLGWGPPEMTRGVSVEEYMIHKGNSTENATHLVTVNGDLVFFNDTDVENGITYTYRIRAVTSIGPGDLSGPFTSTPDGDPPLLSIIHPIDGSYLNSTDQVFRWDCADGPLGSGLTSLFIALDGENPVNVLGRDTLEISNLSEGPHTVRMEAVDLVGNMADAEAAFIVDITDPFIELAEPVNGSFVDSSIVNIDWNASDEMSGIERMEVKMDEGEWIDVGKNLSFTATDLNEGFHEIMVRVFDKSGNSNASGGSFYVDTLAPLVEILSPSNGTISRQTRFLLNWSAGDNIEIIELILIVDDEDPVDLSIFNEYSIEDLSEGKHRFSVIARDLAGNTGSDSVNVTVDRTSPVVLDHGPNGYNAPVSSVIRVSFSEMMRWNAVSLLLEGAPVSFDNNETDISYTPPKPFKFGSRYEVSLTGMDLAGNEIAFDWWFETDRNGTVIGRLMDAGGVPIPYGKVKLDGDVMSTSDTEGYFVFNITFGSHDLAIEAEGYEGKIVKVEVDAGRTTELGEIELAEIGTGDENGGDGKGNWIMIPVIGIVFLLIIILVIVILVRKRGPKEEKIEVFERADGLRTLANRRGLDISDLEPDYKNALYQRSIGDLEDSRHSMERYNEAVDARLEE